MTADRARAAAQEGEHAVAAGLLEELRPLPVPVASWSIRRWCRPRRAGGRQSSHDGSSWPGLGDASGAQGVVARLAEAGALLELGRLDEAEDAAQALGLADVEALKTLALDAACGIALARCGPWPSTGHCALGNPPPAARPAVAFGLPPCGDLRRPDGGRRVARWRRGGFEGRDAWRGPYAAALLSRRTGVAH